VRDLRFVALRTERNAAMAAADHARSEVGMAALALEVQAGVTTGGDHPFGELVVTERALAVDLISGRRRAAELLSAVIAARGQQRDRERSDDRASHRNAP